MENRKSHLNQQADILTHMRNFDDIIPPSRRPEPEASVPNPVPPSARPSNGGRPRRGRPMRHFPYITLVVVVLIIAACVGALFYFTTAKVEVTPNTLTASLQGNVFTAVAASTSTNAIPFQVITAKKIAMQSVQSSGTKQVSSAASGQITIYNKRRVAQRLINRTRFASPSGLIFRIHQAVTVPAASGGTPGSLTVNVTADQAGSQYNIGPSTFSVPGLAGTALANLVYAKSSSAMTGGASGNEPVIAPALAAKTQASLQSALAQTLQKSLAAQVPSGYILLPGAATTTYTQLPPTTATSSSSVNERVQGSISAVVFPNTMLADAIASSQSSSSYSGSPLTIASSTNLTLAPVSGFPASGTNNFTFTISGTAALVYNVDTSQIAAAVAGKSRSAAEVALTNFPSVNQAVLVLRPFWRQNFPQDPTAISVSVAK